MSAAELLTTAEIEALRRNCPADHSIARFAATLEERDLEIERLRHEAAALRLEAAQDIRQHVEEIGRLRGKVNELARELEAELERSAALRAELAVTKTDLDGVWLWQGDGYDHLSSLSCPMVMKESTLRSLIRWAAEDMRAEAAKMADNATADASLLVRTSDPRQSALCSAHTPGIIADRIRAIPLPEEPPAPRSST